MNKNYPPRNLWPATAGVLLMPCGLALGAAVAQTVQVPSLPGTTVTVTTRLPSSGKAEIVSPPPEGALPVGNQINVLVLALDAVDIKAARAVGITRVPPRRAPAAAPEDGVIPIAPRTAIPNLTPPAVEGDIEDAAPPMFLPPSPARPRVPADEMNAPAIAPAKFQSDGFQSDGFQSSAFWRAFAQRNTIQPMTPPPGWDPALNGGAANPDPRANERLLPGMPALVLPDSIEDTQMPSRRPPGPAQLAAAPLRRALTNAGVRDVLTTPLDSATIVRSVMAGRLSTRVLDSLRFSTGQMIESLNANPNAQGPLFAQARQKAIQAASRVGLSLGYRAVIVLALTPKGEYSYLLVDTTRETGETFLVSALGTTATQRDQNGADDAAAELAARLAAWAPFTSTDRAARIEDHMQAAQDAIRKNDLAATQDQLNQVVSLDPSYVAAYLLLGDVLQNSDPIGAASAYQRAAEINTRNGEVWSKIAISHTMSNPPDWVRALSAGEKAQRYGFESASLRTAMAASEFGRAELLRRGGRPDQAEDAESAARRHLDRARELATDDPEAISGISRLMAKYLLEQKRYREAVQSLDLLAMQYPEDLQIQTMYARALEGQGARSEDMFLAWSRVWILSGETEVLVDATRYARIADGFDQRLVNVSKNVFQLTSGVATGALSRETAILQTARLTSEMTQTISGLRLMRPPVGRASGDAHIARLFAADLMQQAMDSYSEFLETGQENIRGRAVDLHRQAIESLNSARAGNE